jgi:hypothetical protein
VEVGFERAFHDVLVGALLARGQHTQPRVQRPIDAYRQVDPSAGPGRRDPAPASSAWTPRWPDSVVLPEPPFWEQSATTCIGEISWARCGCGSHGGRRVGCGVSSDTMLDFREFRRQAAKISLSGKVTRNKG